MARDQLDPGEIDALINELEQKMGRLRAIYEQYFMGIERMPPATLRKDVVRVIHRLENVYVRNTATKFKIRSLIQRFNSYKSYWNRIERQIEEGTYVRDVQRAQRNSRRRERRERRMEEGAAAEADDGVLELDFEDLVDLGDLQAELEAMEAAGAFDKPAASTTSAPGSALSDEERELRKQQKLGEIREQIAEGGERHTGQPQPTPPSQPRSASTAAARGAPVSMSGASGNARSKLQEIKRRMQERTGEQARPSRPSQDDDARRVYDQLLEAKRRCNESTSGLTYEAVAQSMSKQREQLREKRGAKDVEFKVVIKDGRAFLKPEAK